MHGAFTLPDGTFSPPSLNCNIPAATKEITVHYSFDFAQQVSVFALSLIHAHVPQLNKSFSQVHYPSNPLQPGSIYFLTPRKAALFGICCEAIPRQVNYIIDEASDTGKGANTVVSILDHYFDHHGLGEKTATLHADNCCGQNKNNTMMQYLMWRVMTGLHDSITISFLIVGHTKFAPDGCFGLLKREFQRTEVSSLADLEQVVQSSAVVNKSQLVGSQAGESIVPMKDWAGSLGPHFRRLTGIKRYHHFRFDKNTPGVVHLRLYSDSPEEKRRLVKDQNWKPDASDLPPTIPPSGMSLERQQYLFEKIREFCR